MSSHPGKTKHYQTHYMSPHLMLCDCPGLVFPKLDVPMPLQVLLVATASPASGTPIQSSSSSQSTTARGEAACFNRAWEKASFYSIASVPDRGWASMGG